MDKLSIFQQFGKGETTSIRSSNNAVIYTRVSSREQSLTNQSLATQKKYCVEYAQKYNYNILGFFGGTYESAQTDERKEFNKMLKFVKSQKEAIGSIIVFSLDRFSRTGDNAIFISSELRKRGISILSVTQPIDVSTHSGALQQNIHFIFSKYDNDLRREKCVTGMKDKLMQGHWVGTLPIGYSYKREDGAQHQKIVINEKGRFIKKAFELKANYGLSNVDIAIKLERMGFKILHKQLTKTLRNPFYCGLLANGMLKGKVVQGNHEALIPHDLFLKANNVKPQGTLYQSYTKKTNYLPLKGFLKCSTCGGPLTGYLMKKKNKYYYKCNTPGCHCHRSAINMHELFVSHLRRYEIKKQLIRPLRDVLHFNYEENVRSDREQVKVLKSQLTELHKKLDLLEERFAFKEIDEALFEKISKKLRAEIGKFDVEIINKSENLSNPLTYIEQCLKKCQNLADLWDSSDFEERKIIQELVFPEGIMYDLKNDNYRTDRVNEILEITRTLTETYNKSNGENSDKIAEFSPWVEPERIELSSREDDIVPSTCLVDFNCREKQGRQQPGPFLSYCVLAVLSNIARSSSALRHRYTSTRKTRALNDDGRGALSSTLSET